MTGWVKVDSHDEGSGVGREARIHSPVCAIV